MNKWSQEKSVSNYIINITKQNKQHHKTNKSMAKIKLLTYLSLAVPSGVVQKAQTDPTNAPGTTNLRVKMGVLNAWCDTFY